MLKTATVTGLILLVCAGLALADWIPGDGHKMHFPQLPDEAGWNVRSHVGEFLADDWQCSASGPVSELHFWGSWSEGITGELNGFLIRIYSDIPDPDPGNPQTWSSPGQLLWEWYVPNSDVLMIHITPEPQLWEGWFEPLTGGTNFPDHDNYFQYNVFNIPDPFMQEQGQIYWLSIAADVVPTQPTAFWGWKSSVEHFNDNAAYIPTLAGSCVAPDNGTGTADLPAPCDYASTEEVWLIIDGLPPGTTIELDGPIADPVCDGPGICSAGLPQGTCEAAGGSLGGTISCYSATLAVTVAGTGQLDGFVRSMLIPVQMEVHHGPRTPGNMVQTFSSDVYRMQGQLFGDPDFDLLQVVAGTDFGLPSPGLTTLTELRGGDFNVDSFFDITYQIEFQGAPGSVLEGMSGVTTATIRMSQGGDAGDWYPLDEPVALNPISNAWGITMLPDGSFAGGFGEDAYGEGWYFYPEYEWWNVWFYDHPFSYDRYKQVMIEFDVFPLQAGPGFVEVAVNWSTDIWSLEGNPPGDRRPPLPGEGPEDMFIGRQTVFAAEQYVGHYGPFEVTIPQYNPEWVSVDIRGFNFEVPGGVEIHECIAQQEEPLDLAFVISDGGGGDCCIIRGDVNHDGFGPDIADLVYLVSFMFQNGPPPPCEDPVGSGYYPETDMNNDGVGPDIADLVYIVTYMFQNGPPLVPCP